MGVNLSKINLGININIGVIYSGGRKVWRKKRNERKEESEELKWGRKIWLVKKNIKWFISYFIMCYKYLKYLVI